MINNQRIVINERDIVLFKYLLAFKLATSKQINRNIFTGTTLKVVQKRLKKLQKANYIKKIGFDTTGTIKIAYTLTDKTFKAFFHDNTRKRNEFKSKSKAHDLALVDIRDALIDKKIVTNYLSENALHFSSKEWKEKGLEEFISINSDAVVEVNLKKGKFNIALEYEASMKFIDRYKKLLRRYYLKKDIGAVLYICKDEETMKKVQSIDRKLSSKHNPKFYYSLLENVLSGSDKLTFTTILNEHFTIE